MEYASGVCLNNCISTCNCKIDETFKFALLYYRIMLKSLSRYIINHVVTGSIDKSKFLNREPEYLRKSFSEIISEKDFLSHMW